MQQLSSEEIKQFQTKILDWYSKNQRDLPWREVPVETNHSVHLSGTSLQEVKQRDPYKILISEVMSQQTQISRVIPKYEGWLKVFPTVYDLARGSVADVLRLWSGLGYNRRALNLKKTAEIIVSEYGGKFPQDEKELLKLPGIGQYTARALLCFAFNQQIAVVDTNVRKVILTQLFIRHSGGVQNLSEEQHFNVRDSGQARMTDGEVQEVADQLLPYGKAYEWNQALMDYAGAMLKKEKIQIPKQSTFIGSHRYYRGQVLKTLLEKKKMSLKDLGIMLKKDYEEVWLQNLVSELRDEGFVEVEKGVVKLSS
jgi:A/G-specific adenine glycosylase